MSAEVHIEWSGHTHFVGRLFTTPRSSAVSFEYASEWLCRTDAFAIDPASLPLQSGAHHNGSLFSAIQDCGPDRWGRILIERAVRKHVFDARPYQDLDYVLALDDVSRIGALRFRADDASPFLAEHEGNIPPLVQLGALLNAADSVHGDSETAKDLRYLLGHGSPLGGARPKSAVILPDGRFAIAKFPKPDDVRDIAAGEVLALTLAQKSGIRVAEHRLVKAAGRNVSVVSRFDREDGRRIPFLSAKSILGATPDNRGAYTLVADAIRQFGRNSAADLRELWRRAIFSLLVSNYDDHLRNHGFLMRGPGRWELSPAYDLNPVPEIDRANAPQTTMTEENEEPSIGAALKAAPRFDLTYKEAKTILDKALAGTSAWRKVGRRLGLSASVLDAYASAFEHPLRVEAEKEARA